jgi:hypothetical protein
MAERRRRRRAARSGGTENAPKPKRDDSKVATEISSRLDRLFDRIAQWRESREDEELASAVREDTEMMVSGVVSLTGSFPFLRTPLIMLLSILEPLLAFGRVVRILVGRWMARRQAQVEQVTPSSDDYVDSETGIPVYQ